MAANARRRQRLRAFVDSQKEGKPCARCGAEYPSWAMHFHHVRGTKSFTIANCVTGNMKREDEILAEIAKCDVLCGGCHTEEHKRT
jgi:hypothetical protein